MGRGVCVVCPTRNSHCPCLSPRRAVRAAEAALGAIDGIVENDTGLSVHVVDRQDYGALVRDWVSGA